MLFKLFKLLLIALSISACGSAAIKPVKVPNQIDFIKIDDVLRPLTVDFLARCETFDNASHLCRDNLRRLQKVSVDELPSGVLGRCTVWSGTLHRRISISPKALHHPLILEQVMFHELGHCLLDADHVDPVYGNHTMNPFINSVQTIQKERDTLLVTLFTFIEPIVRQFNFHTDGENIPTIPCNHSQ